MQGLNLSQPGLQARPAVVPQGGLLRGAGAGLRRLQGRRGRATSPGSSRLDYLQWLGVDCLWLPPFYASPLRDGGYDIADYTAVLPEFGTLPDFRSSSRRRTPAASA